MALGVEIIIQIFNVSSYTNLFYHKGVKNAITRKLSFLGTSGTLVKFSDFLNLAGILIGL